MRTSFPVLIIFSLLISCTDQSSPGIVSISGSVNSADIKEIMFYGVIDNSIGGYGEQYIAKLDSNSHFSIEIPIKRLATTRISAGRINQDMVLIPGDEFHIQIKGDSVSFSGKGSGKNNFLVASKDAGMSNRHYASAYNKGEMTLDEFAAEMQDFKKKRLGYLATYPDKNELDPKFIEFYKIETQVIYEERIQNYPRRYAYMNKIKIDSLVLPEEYIRLKQLENFMDDKKVVSFNYVHNLRNFLFTKAREVREHYALEYQESIRSVLNDSLTGKTQEYLMAKWIISELSMSKFDSLVYQDFLALERDQNSTETVNKAYSKYKEKQALIGQALHHSFQETMLEDSTHSPLSFQEMMSSYQGKVVYLDIWSLNCAPCLSAMPHSKELKKRLADLPIEFVYLAQDPPRDKVWQEFFDASLTRENHFRMVKHEWDSAEMLKFMEINWVPCYMIFDKEGKLADYNADRPYVRDGMESNLEKTLKQLANI